MKIKITEIEANAEDIRGSQTLGAAFSNAIRNAFSNVGVYGVPNGSSVCDDEDEDVRSAKAARNNIRRKRGRVMDRNEAIRVIEELLADRDNDSTYPCVSSPRHYEALDLAIEALKGGTEGDVESATAPDCISRADIEYHTQLEARGNGQYEEVKVAYKSDIDNLPPVAPTERTGEWVWIVYPLKDEGRVELECPMCGQTVISAVDYRPNFCEHCGCKMGGDTE